MELSVGPYESSTRKKSTATRNESISDSSTGRMSRKDKEKVKLTKKEKKSTGLGRTMSGGSSTSAWSEASFASKNSLNKKDKKTRSKTPDRRPSPVPPQRRRSKTPEQMMEPKRKPPKVVGAERKGSLVDKWSKMVDEYEDSYIPEKENRRMSKMEHKRQRKVSKLENVDTKFDNIGQVFGRGMPLAHQTAPPGAKARDIESESERSEASVQSYNATMSPIPQNNMRRQSASPSKRVSQVSESRSERRVSNTSSVNHGLQRDENKRIDRRESEIDRSNATINHLDTKRTSTSRQKARKQSTAFGKIANEKSRTDKRLSSANSVGSQYPRWTDSDHAAQAKWAISNSPQQQAASTRHASIASNKSANEHQIIRQTKEKAPRSVHKEKYHKHRRDSRKDLDETAADIVDDVVNGALKLLYGNKSPRKVSNRAISNRKSVQDNQTYLENINQSYNQTNISDSTEMYVNKKQYRNLKDERMHDYQSSPVATERKYSIKPVPRSGTGRNMSLAPPPQGAWRHNGYDLQIGSHGTNEDFVSEAASPTSSYQQNSLYNTNTSYSDYQYNSLPSQNSSYVRRGDSYSMSLPRGDRSTGGVYSSDSEYSTTIERRRDSDRSVVQDELGNRIRHYGGDRPNEHMFYDGERSNKKHAAPRPSTLTKGSVTKVLHELNEAKHSPHFAPRQEYKQSKSVETVAASRTVSPSSTATAGDTLYTSQPVTRHVLVAPSSVVDSYSSLPRSLVQEAEVLEIKADSTGTTTSNTYILNQPYVVTSGMPAPNQFPTGVNYMQPSSMLLQTVKPQKVDFLIDASDLANQEILKLNQQVQEQESPHELPTIQEVDENQYAAFSNEPIIVADINKHNEWRSSPGPKNEEHIIEGLGGKVYGTKPAVNMSSKQQLNFFIFNQVKKDGQEAESMIDDSMILKDAIDSTADRELEYREMEIYNKGTQTILYPEPTPPPRRKRITTEKSHKALTKTAPPPPSPPPRVEHREIHHYITTEREVEKLQPEKELYDFSTQTDPPRRIPSPVQQPAETFVTQSFLAPVITETRSMEKTHSTLNPSPPPSPTPIPSASVEEESEESEEEILETTVIEEKVQRIAMSIMEEIEFSSNRTQGGTTTNTTNDKMDVKPFWIPDKWETVVDRRRQKVTRVNDTTNDGEETKQGRGPLARTSGTTEQMALGPPRITSDKTYSYSSNQRETETPEERSSTEFVASRQIPIATESSGYEYQIPIATNVPSRVQVIHSPPRRRRSPSPHSPHRSSSPQRPLFDSQREIVMETERVVKPVQRQESSGSDTLSEHIASKKTHIGSSKPPAPPPPLVKSREIMITRSKDNVFETSPQNENTEKIFTSGSLRRSMNKASIALPEPTTTETRRFHTYDNSDDQLPESLDHFDRVVAKLERELPLPMSPESTSPTESLRRREKKSPKTTSYQPVIQTFYDRHSPPEQVSPAAEYTQSYKETTYPSTTARTFTNIAANAKPTYHANQSYIQTSDTSISPEPAYRVTNITTPKHSGTGEGKTIYSSKHVTRTSSNLEPENFSFSRRGDEVLGESKEVLFDPNETYLTPVDVGPRSDINHPIGGIESLEKAVVYSSQSEPVMERKIIRDADGNLVKVTEMKHTMSKTVEYPSERNSIASSDQQSVAPENRELGRQSYLRMNLTETSKKETVEDGDSETESTHMVSTRETRQPTYTGPEVTSDTEVAMVPVEFDVLQKSIKVSEDDGQAPAQQSFLYNMNTQELHPSDSYYNEELRRKYIAGETMRTSL